MRERASSDARGRDGRLPGLVRTDLAGEFVVGELDVLFAEHSEELVDAEVEQAELRVGVARQMQYDEAVAVADDALDAEVVDRRHLRRDVVVLEVLGHLGEPAAAPEAEERAAGRGEGGEGRRGRRAAPGRRAAAAAVMMVDVDDALTTHAEREAAVLVQDAVARQRALREPRRVYIHRTHHFSAVVESLVARTNLLNVEPG